MKRLDVYKCEVCGNIIEVNHVGGGNLVCCNQPMKHMIETTTDGAVEKHVPVVEKITGGYKVTVGEVAHPMTEEHYIQWIELISGDKSYLQFLKPTGQPTATFMIDSEPDVVKAYCNIHGHWKNK